MEDGEAVSSGVYNPDYLFVLVFQNEEVSAHRLTASSRWLTTSSHQLTASSRTILIPVLVPEGGAGVCKVPTF